MEITPKTACKKLNDSFGELIFILSDRKLNEVLITPCNEDNVHSVWDQTGIHTKCILECTFLIILGIVSFSTILCVSPPVLSF